MAERMQNRGTLDAFDLYKGRVNLIKKGAERLQLTIVSANVRDAAEGTCEKQYDRVLCDVPCSGLGVIRRKPEIRYKKPESFADLPQLQLKILSRSAQLVRPGGLLFYSTCTLNRAENGAVVQQFLKDNPDFEPYALPLSGIRRTLEHEDTYMLTMMPMDFGGDGFFAAGLRRKERIE
jgi:16S rRNA (cytosine967-C5)-methyltransferase